jgi:O-antigen ligase
MPSSLKIFPSFEAFLGALAAILVALSLIFRGGIDIWIQTVVHLATYLIFTIYILYRIYKRQTIIIPKTISLLFIFVGLCFTSVFSYNRYNSEIEFFNWASLLLFFYIGLQIEDMNTADKFFIFPLYIFLSVLSVIFFCSEVLHLFYLPQHIIFNPNVFAALCCMFVFIGMRHYTNSTNMKYRMLWLLSVTFLVLIICSTKSESALFSLIAVVIISILPPLGKKKSVFKYFAILLLVVLAILVKIGEINDRLSWWFTAMRIFLSSPLTGIGIGNFYRYAYQYDVGKLHSLYAHNYYLQLFAEGGIVLGLPVVVFFIEVLRQIKDKFLLSTVLVVLLNNIVEYNLSIFSVGLMFFFIIGCSFCERKYVNLKKFKSVFSFCVVAIFLLLTYYNAKLFVADIYLARGEYYLKMGQGRPLTSHELNLAEKMFSKHLLLKNFSSAGYYTLSCVYMNKYIVERKNFYLYKAVGYMEKAIELEDKYAGNYAELFQIYKLIGDAHGKLYVISKLQKLNVRWELLRDLLAEF